MPEEADGGGRSPAGISFGERSQLSKDQEGLILAADDRSIPIVVAASPEAETPQLAQSSDPLPIPVESEDKSPDQTDSPKDLKKKLAEASESGSSRIYGIKRRTLFLIILGIVITIGVVIGGALGGTLPSRKHKEPSPIISQTGTTDLPPTTSPTTASSTPMSTSTTGFQMQIWENTGYQGRSEFFNTAGRHRTSFPAKSYHWAPGKFSDTTRCSIAICFDDNEVDSWAFTEKSEPGNSQNASFEANYVNIACSDFFKDPGCASTSPSPSGSNETCTYTDSGRTQQGNCIAPAACSSNFGFHINNRCSKGEDNKCCLQETCNDGAGGNGLCLNANTADGKQICNKVAGRFVTDRCSGPTDVKCCVWE